MTKPMPTWDELMVPVLRVLSDGQVHSRRQLHDVVAVAEQLTDDQRSEALASGQSKFHNRIGWATSDLNRVGAIERPSRGQYRILDLGRQLLRELPHGITERDLRAHARPGDEWWIAKVRTSAEQVGSGSPSGPSLDPTEQIESGIARINAEIATDLLSRLHGKEPTFFEQAVVTLLVAMGYGGADSQATVTSLSNDGGIDGIIDQDTLGLNKVYVQAKRYAPGMPPAWRCSDLSCRRLSEL